MALRVRIFFAGWRFVRQQPQQIFLLLRLSTWLMLLSLLLKFWSLQRVLQFFTLTRPLKKSTIAPQELATLVDHLLSFDFFVFTPTCWKRAIILHRFLGLSGIATRVIFGVRRENENKLAGHAWLELQGQPFLEQQAPDYVVTYSFPA